MELKKIICETPEQFHAEVVKWQKKGAAPITRGRRLIAYGETVAEFAPSKGGYRTGSGRPRGTREKAVTIKLSQEAVDKLNSLTSNKSEYIDNLILNQ